MKTCKDCGEHLPDSDFSKHWASKDSLKASCIVCRAKKRAEGGFEGLGHIVQPNPNRKPAGLKDETIRAIRLDHKRGSGILKLCSDYSLHRWIIVDIINRRTYADIE